MMATSTQTLDGELTEEQILQELEILEKKKSRLELLEKLRSARADVGALERKLQEEASESDPSPPKRMRLFEPATSNIMSSGDISPQLSGDKPSSISSSSISPSCRITSSSKKRKSPNQTGLQKNLPAAWNISIPITRKDGSYKGQINPTVISSDSIVLPAITCPHCQQIFTNAGNLANHERGCYKKSKVVKKAQVVEKSEEYRGGSQSRSSYSAREKFKFLVDYAEAKNKGVTLDAFADEAKVPTSTARKYFIFAW